jgi:DNA phosphorothioation-dependent restriction protein DptG
MKQAITIRIDPELLAYARARAKEENRTLTNFLETVLKERVNASSSSVSRRSGSSSSNGLLNDKS